MSRSIRVVSYRQDWPARYRTIAARIAPLVPSGALLHHIGSTAVPGLVSKDVIDLQLTVDRLEPGLVTPLLAAGFVHKPDRTDHAPAGQTLAPGDCTKLYLTLSAPEAHLHVREQGRYNQRYAVLFRDYLRADPAAAAAYGAAKQALAGAVGGDRDRYYAVKDPLCDAIIAAAEIWACSTGWCQPRAD